MATSLNTSISVKVLCLLLLHFGYSSSQSTMSLSAGNSNLQPSPTASASNWLDGTVAAITSSSVNATLVLSTSGVTGSQAPSPSSVTTVESSSAQVNSMPPEWNKQEIEETFGLQVEELGQTFTKAIDPFTSKPVDEKVIETLVSMTNKGVALLRKYNESGNATIDYFNITDSLVISLKKFDCVQERAADIPDRSNRNTRKDLQKVNDFVEMKFDCPLIVINATPPENSHSRKRREVHIEVTMEVSGVENGNDFHEFQLRHHHSRFRRDAAVPQQCGPPKCGIERFSVSKLGITNRQWSENLKNTSSQEFIELSTELQTSLKEVLKEAVDKIHSFIFSLHSSGFRAEFYLDVDINHNVNVTTELKKATENNTLKNFTVDITAMSISGPLVVVDGNYSLWTDWSTPCDANYQQMRTRECKDAVNGGQCYGDDKEIRKCDCGDHLTDGGNITTPMFPSQYPTEVKCVWVLEAPENHTVKLSLEEFKLEKDKKCLYDYFEVFEGNTTDEEYRIGNRLCGSHGHRVPFESKGRKMSIVFKSDRSVTFQGFRAEWKTQKIKEEVIEYVPQYVTVLTMVYSPNVNGTHYPLGTASTCITESQTNDKECVFKEKVFVISRVIINHIDRDLSLAGDNRIVIVFEHIMNENLFPSFYNGKKYCVSWNQKAKLQTTGSWTRQGCSVLKTNITHTSCACDHQGIFAVLGQEKIDSSKLNLLANTYIGIGISYFILILAIVHIVWKVEVHGGEVMRINMCVAIMIMQSVFLIGAHVKAQQALCGFLSFAVYFSVLAEFCWLLLHGLRIHGRIKKLFASNLNIEIVYFGIGWGLPLFLGLIAIGVKIDLKDPDNVCWEAAVGGAMWGYAMPVIAIALLNVAVLVKLLTPTQDVRDGYDYEEMRYRVIKDMFILLCFGLTCTFAYQAVEEERFLEQYLLSSFVIMQALAMFVFGREGRKDFIKRVEKAKAETEPEPAIEEPVENIYEDIEEEKAPEEKSAEKGRVKKTRKRAPNKPPERMAVSTLKNLNIYKEGDQYVIEA